MMAPYLPFEIILTVLDQLVGSSERHPIFDPSNPVTKTLRALTLTSRSIYPLASRHLYRHCLHLRDRVSYACFSRTIGIGLGSNHPQSLLPGQAGRNEELWSIAKTPQYITSIVISPLDMSSINSRSVQLTPMVRLSRMVDLCNLIGPSLKRLILNLQPISATHSEVEILERSQRETNIFLAMPNLEELVASYDISNFFRLPPPLLKRLAVTIQDLHDLFMTFCFSISTLQTLVLLRPVELSASDINRLFFAYRGRDLDIILVDVNPNHRTPKDTRDWTDDDAVKIWEADVPTSFYGDENDLTLCENWIWTQAIEGTLWTQADRRMASWSEIQRRLAGPVHQFIENS